MEQKADLRVPTVAVPVTVGLVGHQPVTAELFVIGATRRSRTLLLDDMAAMLDDETSFVPVRLRGGVRLIAKRSIVVVSIKRHEQVAPDHEDFDDSPSEVITLYDRQHRVEVKLSTGASLVGTLFDSSPADRPRVIDHLNRALRFVRLWTPQEHHFIHKDHISEVSEQE